MSTFRISWPASFRRPSGSTRLLRTWSPGNRSDSRLTQISISSIALGVVRSKVVPKRRLKSARDTFVLGSDDIEPDSRGAERHFQFLAEADRRRRVPHPGLTAIVEALVRG